MSHRNILHRAEMGAHLTYITSLKPAELVRDLSFFDVPLACSMLFVRSLEKLRKCVFFRLCKLRPAPHCALKQCFQHLVLGLL